MARDYYNVLNCGRNATPIDIANNFRVLALMFHPDKNKDNGQLAMASYSFSEICEAYEVLSNPELKAIYDRYGEDLLKNGVPDKKLGFKGGYTFLGNTHEIFERFFGTANPFAVQLDDHSEQIGVMKQKGSMMDAFMKRFTNLTVTCSCTLEEFYYGCKKTITF